MAFHLQLTNPLTNPVAADDPGQRDEGATVAALERRRSASSLGGPNRGRCRRSPDARH